MATTERIEDSTVAAFDEQVRGTVLQPDDEGYDEARTVWNAMIDREPAVVVRCAGTADVVAGVAFARDLDLRLAVKGGGHNVAGTAVCDDGLVIDLSPMNGVHVNPDRRIARVGGGATWADFDHEAQAFGLATTGGIVSSTGVAGVTLGGGLGYLARKYGLAHDNLRSMEVVTADGSVVRASEDEHPELFWGLRGGGGNFGIVTAFEFDLHEVGPELFSVRLLYPYDAAPDVLRFYREFMAEAPNDVQCYAAFAQGSPQLGLPEELHGETLFTLGGLYAGEVDDGRDAFRPLREFGEPIADQSGPKRYTDHQSQNDDLYREGDRNYWKSAFYDDLSDELIDAMMDRVDPLPSPLTTVFIEWMGGAIAEADRDASAFPHRDRTFALTAAPKWTDAARDDDMIGWAREFHAGVTPYAADGVYVNYLDEDDAERVPDAYGDRYERLRDLKTEWDPENLFRANQNIEPAD